MFNGYWILFYTIERIVNILGYNTYLDVNFNKKTSTIANWSSILIYSFVDYNIGYIGFLNVIEILIRIILIIVFCKVNYSTSFKEVIKSIVGYWIVIYQSIRVFSENILPKITISYTTINGIDIYTGETYISGEIMTLQMLIFKLILISLAILIYKQYKEKDKLDKSYIKFMVIPIITNLICLLLLFRNTALEKNKDMLTYLNSIIIPLTIMISNIYLFNLLDKSIKSYKLKLENKSLKDSIAKDYNYYLEIQKEQEKIKKINHDIKNHMICIRSMSEAKDEKLLDYIDNMESNMMAFNTNYNFNSGNMILDSILNNKNAMCIENKIKFVVNVNFSKCDFMDMADVCSMFANLIDNAIEANLNIYSNDIVKEIILKSVYVSEMCVIKIENNKENQILCKNGNFITTKKDKNLHGIGLKNVSEIVKKYNGEMVVDYTDTRFIVKILLPIKI